MAARENAVSDQSIHQLSDLVKKIALKDKIAESREFAGDVEDSLYAGLQKGNAGLKDRGVKKAPFVVLIGANMPSILAEISFVTNPKDAAATAAAGVSRTRGGESVQRHCALRERAERNARGDGAGCGGAVKRLKCGGPGQSPTADLRVRSALLYATELPGLAASVTGKLEWSDLCLRSSVGERFR